MSKKSKLGVAFAVAAAFTVMAPVANAATYSYKGDLFTTKVGTYIGVSELTGFFRVAGLLPAGVTTNVVPDNYSFFDGVQTLTKANSTINSFSITTDLANNIVGWAISLQRFTGNSIGFILSGAGGDTGTQSTFIPPTSGVGSVDTPGEWTTAIPVPASLPLLASGIGGLIYLGRGRKKAKAGYKIAA